MLAHVAMCVPKCVALRPIICKAADLCPNVYNMVRILEAWVTLAEIRPRKGRPLNPVCLHTTNSHQGPEPHKYQLCNYRCTSMGQHGNTQARLSLSGEKERNNIHALSCQQNNALLLLLNAWLLIMLELASLSQYPHIYPHIHTYRKIAGMFTFILLWPWLLCLLSEKANTIALTNSTQAVLGQGWTPCWSVFESSPCTQVHSADRIHRLPCKPTPWPKACV